MRVSSVLSLSCLAVTTQAYWKGFNLPAQLPHGACKQPKDWQKDFDTLKGLPGHFTSVRLYASSDCNTLANVVPLAIKNGIKVLVGVWTQDDNHFNAEKQALLAAVKRYGHDWIISVSVGSEDLYRKEADPQIIANKIYDVRGMLGTVGAGHVQVGHVDTWTAWVDPKNKVVIKACDFVGTDGYPYFQSSSRDSSYNVFWQSIEATRNMVNSVKPGTWVWIAETGWPVHGPTKGAAVASVSNAGKYWKSVACSAFTQAHTFWYTLQDYTQSPSFGVVGADFKPLYDLKC